MLESDEGVIELKVSKKWIWGGMSIFGIYEKKEWQLLFCDVLLRN